MDSQSQKKTRIQAPELRSVKFSQSDSQGVATGPSQASEQSALASDGISSSSLADLCDSRYLHGKGKLGKKLTGPTSDSGNRKNASKPTEIKQQSSFSALGSQSSQSTQPTKSGLRVEMIDGKMVIKESSLIVNDAAINETEYEEVEEGALVNSRYSSFTNRRPAKAWGLEETRLFYNVLRQCGLEFSLMQSFFPNRTRKEIKLKFRREEREHPELIKKALETSLPLEMTPFELQLGEEIKYGATAEADVEADAEADADADADADPSTEGAAAELEEPDSAEP